MLKKNNAKLQISVGFPYICTYCLNIIIEGEKYMRYLIILMIAAISFTADAKENFYDLKAEKIEGDTLYFSELKGKKLMIVNTASYCGYTDQYEDLQTLYEEYGGEHFEIIAFPANNFMNQEPGTDEEIKKFCEEEFGITFTLMSKISVKGENMHPVYQWLTQKSKNGVKDSEVQWNFQKYLITENGDLYRVLSTQTNPLNPLVFNWLEESVGVDDDLNKEKAVIYPNPASEYILINLSEIINYQDKRISNIAIYNTFGECVMNETMKSVGSSQRIDITELPAGKYFIYIGNAMMHFIKF